MKVTKIFLVMAICLTLVSCRREDRRVITLSVPEMKNQACATRILYAVIGEITRGEPTSIQTHKRRKYVQYDVEKRLVTVNYESMTTAIKNIEHAIAGAGFSCWTLKADGARTEGVPTTPEAQAALPANCK